MAQVLMFKNDSSLEDLFNQVELNYQKTQEPVMVSKLVEQYKLSRTMENKLRVKLRSSGWTGRPRRGYAPADFWKAEESGKPGRVLARITQPRAAAP